MSKPMTLPDASRASIHRGSVKSGDCETASRTEVNSIAGRARTSALLEVTAPDQIHSSGDSARVVNAPAEP
jgi:hypothetical protein